MEYRGTKIVNASRGRADKSVGRKDRRRFELDELKTEFEPSDRLRRRLVATNDHFLSVSDIEKLISAQKPFQK